MKKLKFKDLLSKLHNDGFDISKRTFEYYQNLGLLPKPIKQVGVKGRGVYGYYNPSVISSVKYIFKLKEAGYSLDQILKEGEKKIIEVFDASLRKWLRLETPLSEVRGYESFKKGLLMRHHWWDYPEKVELEALNYALIKIIDSLPGLKIACSMIEEEIPSTKGADNRIAQTIKEKLTTKIKELEKIASQINKRIIEIERATRKRTARKPVVMWEGANKMT